MDKFKKVLWMTLGFICLGIAYIGVITPGIPWSTPTVGAAYCFAKGSKRWHNWIMNHRLFGPFLRGWAEKRVFPIKARILMVVTMDVSLIIMWFTTQNWKAVVGTAILMFLVAVWALRYPESVEEHDARKEAGKKIGWFS